MTKRMYLICLTDGGGDTYITLANYAAKEWIESPFDSSKGSDYEEEIPAAVCEGMDDYIDSPDTDDDGIVTYNPRKANITIGSYDNDRAIACPGISFSRTAEAFKYAKANDMEIVDGYHGYSY